MTDWHIISEDNEFPEFPVDDPQPSRRSSFWRWSLLIGSMIITLLIVGLFILQEQQKDQAAVRENLTAFIIHEESLRLAGNRTQVESLIAPDAPQAWRDAYLNLFEEDNLHFVASTIRLGNIDFEGRCAIAEVDISESKQVRAYCRDDEHWQRTAVPGGVWGYGQTVINFPNGASLYFFPRDQAFAEALSADLIKFFAGVMAVLGEQSVYKGLEIRIEPHDLHAPFVLDDGSRVIVNSPWLLPIQGGRVGDSSEAMVRLVLAKALLHRANPTSAELPGNLPGVVRFLHAAQTIAAQHLMDSPDNNRTSTISPHSPSQEDLFYLMADNIYRQCGLQTLMNIVQRLPSTSSWDDIYPRPLKRSLLIMNNEAISGGDEVDRRESSAMRDICSMEPDSQ